MMHPFQLGRTHRRSVCYVENFVYWIPQLLWFVCKHSQIVQKELQFVLDIAHISLV